MSSSVPKTEHHEVKIGLVFFGIVVTMLLSSLNQTILSTAMPTIVGELHGVDKLPWVMTSFMLSSTIMLPIYGRISDLVGRKQLLMSAIVIFMIGTVIGGLSTNINILLIARLVQGIGGGGLMILSQASIAEVVPPRERGKYTGILGGVFAFSSVAGPLIGGWLTESLSWRWVFWFNIPLGLLALFVVGRFLHLPVRAKQELNIDYIGMLLLSLVTICVVLISLWGGKRFDWVSLPTFLLVLAIIICLFLLYLVEDKAKSPVMPRELFKVLNFNLTTVAGLFIGIAMFGAVSYMPTYFQFTLDNIDAQKAGLLMIPMMGSLLVTSVITGRIVTETGRYKYFPVIGTLIMAAALYLLSTVKLATPVWHTCVFLGILGCGIGMSMQILVLVVQNSFSINLVGTATAANNYFRQIGATLGASVVGSVFTNRLMDYVKNRITQEHIQAAKGVNLSNLTPTLIKSLPEPVKGIIVYGYNHSLMPVFLYLVPLAVLASLVLAFVKEKPLASKIS